MNPRISMWINVALVVIAAISTGAIPITGILDAQTAKLVGAWCCFITALVAAVNVGLHGMSSPQSGPMYTPPSPPSKTPAV